MRHDDSRILVQFLSDACLPALSPCDSVAGGYAAENDFVIVVDSVLLSLILVS